MVRNQDGDAWNWEFVNKDEHEHTVLYSVGVEASVMKPPNTGPDGWTLSNDATTPGPTLTAVDQEGAMRDWCRGWMGSRGILVLPGQ